MAKVRKNSIGRDEIWCQCRRKWVAYTPEEEVRQWFVEVLISKGVHWSRIAVEQSVVVGERRLRADIIVYDENREAEILCECKAPNVEINDAVFAQIHNYNTILGVRTMIVTNGKTTLTKTL